MKSEVREVKDDAEIRRRAIDRVIDAGGEVLRITVDHGAVRLRGRLGQRDDIALVRRLLRGVDGVTAVDARFAVVRESGPLPTSVKSPGSEPSGPARG